MNEQMKGGVFEAATRVYLGEPGSMASDGCAPNPLLPSFVAYDMLMYYGRDAVTAVYDLDRWPTMRGYVNLKEFQEASGAAAFLQFLRPRATVAPVLGSVPRGPGCEGITRWTLLIELVPIPVLCDLRTTVQGALKQKMNGAHTSTGKYVRRQWGALATEYLMTTDPARDGSLIGQMQDVMGVQPAKAHPRILVAKVCRHSRARTFAHLSFTNKLNPAPKRCSCQQVGTDSHSKNHGFGDSVLKLIGEGFPMGNSGAPLLTGFGTREVAVPGPVAGTWYPLQLRVPLQSFTRKCTTCCTAGTGLSLYNCRILGTKAGGAGNVEEQARFGFGELRGDVAAVQKSGFDDPTGVVHDQYLKWTTPAGHQTLTEQRITVENGQFASAFLAEFDAASTSAGVERGYWEPDMLGMSLIQTTQFVHIRQEKGRAVTGTSNAVSKGKNVVYAACGIDAAARGLARMRAPHSEQEVMADVQATDLNKLYAQRRQKKKRRKATDDAAASGGFGAGELNERGELESEARRMRKVARSFEQKVELAQLVTAGSASTSDVRLLQGCVQHALAGRLQAVSPGVREAVAVAVEIPVSMEMVDAEVMLQNVTGAAAIVHLLRQYSWTSLPDVPTGGSADVLNIALDIATKLPTQWCAVLLLEQQLVVGGAINPGPVTLRVARWPVKERVGGAVIAVTLVPTADVGDRASFEDGCGTELTEVSNMPSFYMELMRDAASCIKVEDIQTQFAYDGGANFARRGPLHGDGSGQWEVVRAALSRMRVAPRTSVAQPDELGEDGLLTDIRAVMLDPYFGSITQCHDLTAADFACFHSHMHAAKTRFPANRVTQVLHALASYQSALEREVMGFEKVDRIFFPMRMFFHEFPGVAVHLLGSTEVPEMPDIYRAMRVPRELAMATGPSPESPIPAVWLELIASQHFGARDTRAVAGRGGTGPSSDYPDNDIIIGMAAFTEDTDNDDDFDLMALGA